MSEQKQEGQDAGLSNEELVTVGLETAYAAADFIRDRLGEKAGDADRLTVTELAMFETIRRAAENSGKSAEGIAETTAGHFLLAALTGVPNRQKVEGESEAKA